MIGAAVLERRGISRHRAAADEEDPDAKVAQLERQLEQQRVEHAAVQLETAARIGQLECVLDKVSPTKRNWHMEDAEELTRLRAEVARLQKALCTQADATGEMEEAVHSMAQAQRDQRRMYQRWQTAQAAVMLRRSLWHRTLKNLRRSVSVWLTNTISVIKHPLLEVQCCDQRAPEATWPSPPRPPSHPPSPAFTNCASPPMAADEEMLLILQHNTQAHKRALDDLCTAHQQDCTDLVSNGALLAGATALAVAWHHLSVLASIDAFSTWRCNAEVAGTAQAHELRRDQLRDSSEKTDEEKAQLAGQLKTSQQLAEEHAGIVGMLKSDVEQLSKQLREAECESEETTRLQQETDDLISFFTQREAARQLCKHCCTQGSPSVVGGSVNSVSAPKQNRSLLGRVFGR